MGICKHAALGAAVAVAMAYGHADAASLSIVNVRAPLHCLFSVNCPSLTPTGTVDSAETITVPSQVWSGAAHLITRTFQANLNPLTAERTFYEYRLDLSQAVTVADSACITDLSVHFGAATQVQYNGTGPLDDVYVIIQPNVGTIGLLSADETKGVITFTFSAPICAGTTPGTGESSRFFGLASTLPPRAVSATVDVAGLGPIDVKMRAPGRRTP